jgi:predicted nucleic acid-binding protein
MIVIADSSALIALAISEQLSLLEKIFIKVIVTQEVYNECVALDKPYSNILKEFLITKVYMMSHIDFNMSLMGDIVIDQGELSAIFLYKKLNADVLLIDDKKGKKVARLNAINCIGSIGVLLLAKRKNLLTEIKPSLIKILNSNIFISQKIINAALIEAGECIL